MPKTPAFATGSRVYGKPREDSDLDLVIYCTDAETIGLLRANCDPGSAPRGPYPSLRFGKLQIVLLEDEAKYHAWRKGTKALKALAPNGNKTLATHIFKELLKNVGPTS